MKTELGKKHAATFTTQYTPLFRADQPASMKIEAFAEQDTLFFILIFIYSEFKRRDEVRAVYPVSLRELLIIYPFNSWKATPMSDAPRNVVVGVV